jgi:hypothetical protein
MTTRVVGFYYLNLNIITDLAPGVHGGAGGRGTALQTGRSRI